MKRKKIIVEEYDVDDLSDSFENMDISSVVVPMEIERRKYYVKISVEKIKEFKPLKTVWCGTHIRFE
jgi:hypothetical protein